MRRSGNDISLFRVGDRVPEPLPDHPILVEDDRPWIDLAFRMQPPRDVSKHLTESANGQLFQTPDPPGGEGVWYRWRLWAEKDESARRRGIFELGGPNTGLPLVRAYAEPVSVFQKEEYQWMIGELHDALAGATWASGASQPGVQVQPTKGMESVAELLANVEHELQLAVALARDPAIEFAPLRPGQRSVAGAPTLGTTTELPENCLIGWWAAHRARQLLRARDEVAVQRSQRSSSLHETSPVDASSRHDDVSRSIIGADDLLRRLLTLANRLFPMVRHESPDLRGIGPALTRDRRRRQLLEALRRNVHTPTLEKARFLSRLRERTFSSLFESWGAVALHGALRSLGWAERERPQIQWLDEWSRERVTWRYSNGSEGLDLVYEPHATTWAMGPQTVAGALLGPAQRASLSRGSSDLGLFSVHHVASPDYVIVLRRAEGLAFTVGDALASNLNFARKDGKGTSVCDKLKKVASTYPGNLSWRSTDCLTRCSGVAAFVLLPGAIPDWETIAPIAQQLRSGHGRLLGACPKAPGMGPALDVADVGRIVDTLRAHALDGSHRMPHIPGGDARDRE